MKLSGSVDIDSCCCWSTRWADAATRRTAKAFERGLNPIVVVNKIDRLARPDWVIDQVFDLDTLRAEEQLTSVIYASL